MLHWGNVFLKQSYNLDLKFKEIWPKKEELLKYLFLGTVIKVHLVTKILFKRF